MSARKHPFDPDRAIQLAAKTTLSYREIGAKMAEEIGRPIAFSHSNVERAIASRKRKLPS